MGFMKERISEVPLAAVNAPEVTKAPLTEEELAKLDGMSRVELIALVMRIAGDAWWVDLGLLSHEEIKSSTKLKTTDLIRLGKRQFQLAMEGHPGMLIWLGKQYLGQSDKQEVETHTEVNIMVSNAMAELDSIPKDVLLKARNIIRGSMVDVTPDS